MSGSAGAPLGLSREQILGHRRRAGSLDRRLRRSPDALRAAASAGLQDSMPRAALLSIHARVEGTQPSTWEDPAFVQVWGPRFSAYVIAAGDVAAFTLSRLSNDPTRRAFAEDIADRLETFLDGRRMSYAEAGRGLGVNPNALRYAAPTGRVLIRWEGARRPTIWMVPPPEIEPAEARRELLRRYLHVFGPATPASFEEWAGIRSPGGGAAFEGVASLLTAVRTPLGEGFILTADEASFRADPDHPAPARLLPSGDAYFLLQGADRELLVPDPDRRARLWTSRVWPGAVLVGGEIVGTWRRADRKLTIDAWRRLSAEDRAAVEAEAASLPLPEITGPITVAWAG